MLMASALGEEEVSKLAQRIRDKDMGICANRLEVTVTRQPANM
jgi:hypothetical protein